MYPGIARFWERLRAITIHWSEKIELILSSYHVDAVKRAGESDLDDFESSGLARISSKELKHFFLWKVLINNDFLEKVWLALVLR